MTKPTDGDAPESRETENQSGTEDISRQSTTAPSSDTPGTEEEAAPLVNEEAPADPEPDPAEVGTVDFVLADSPAVAEDSGTHEEGFSGRKNAQEKSGDPASSWPPLMDTNLEEKTGDSPTGASPDEAASVEASAEPPHDAVEGFNGAVISDPGEYAFGPVERAPESADATADAAGKITGERRASPKRVPGPFAGKSLGPVLTSRAMMIDKNKTLVPTPPTLPSRLFTALALVPILLPVALFLVQVVFSLDTRALWYSDEVRYAGAYRSMVDSADWLVLHLNGMLYPDKPPLFFWFLYGLEETARAALPLLPFAVTLTDTMIFFMGVALSGLLCLLATHALASLVGRVDRRTVLAADLILLSGFFFAGLAHYVRMDLLFAAFITISHIFLFHAYVRGKAPLLMTLGYLFAGTAVLVKGPLGLAFPLLAVVSFLLWQGRFGRFFKLDSLFGVIIGLAVPCVWLVLAKMNAGDLFFYNVLHKQILARALNTWHHAEPWYHYLMTLPLIWLPWTLILLFLPWGRFMGKSMREGLKASRTPDAAGIAYLWCAFLPGFVLLSVVSIKIPIYCLPLFPPLAVLCARAVLGMRPFAAACLQYSLALLLAVFGLALVVMPAVPVAYLPVPYVPRGVMVLGGVCLLFAVMLAFLIKPRRAEGSVLLMALFTTVFAYPLWTVTAPSLDAFLSPKAQAGVLKEYRDAGYAPVAYKVYPGTYTYYAGNIPDSPGWEDVLKIAAANPKTVIALRASFWDTLDPRPEGFVEVNRQTIAERDYVLVARPPLPAKGAENNVPADDGTEPDQALEDARPASPDAGEGNTSLPDADAAPNAATGAPAAEAADMAKPTDAAVPESGVAATGRTTGADDAGASGDGLTKAPPMPEYNGDAAAPTAADLGGAPAP